MVKKENPIDLDLKFDIKATGTAFKAKRKVPKFPLVAQKASSRVLSPRVPVILYSSVGKNDGRRVLNIKPEFCQC